MNEAKGTRKRLGVIALIGLLTLTAVPGGVAVAEPTEGGGRLAMTLEHVADLLMQLESELAALERPAAEHLEERLEDVIEAIENLLDGLDGSRQEVDEAARRARLAAFDLQLHRLVYLLEEIVESSSATPQRSKADAEESIDRLKILLDSIIMDASFGMEQEQFDQLEEAVYKTARLLGGRVQEMAQKVEPKTATPRLAHLVERLEELLFRLDALILHRSPRRQ